MLLNLNSGGNLATLKRKRQFLASIITICAYLVLFYGLTISSSSSSSSRSGQSFPVGEQIEVTVTYSLPSFLKVTYGLEPWMLHASFLAVLILANMLWIHSHKVTDKGNPAIVGRYQKKEENKGRPKMKGF